MTATILSVVFGVGILVIGYRIIKDIKEILNTPDNEYYLDETE